MSDYDESTQKIARCFLYEVLIYCARTFIFPARIRQWQQRPFKITALNSIVERSFAWLRRNRRSTMDYEYSVQISDMLIEIAGTRLILSHPAPA